MTSRHASGCVTAIERAPGGKQAVEVHVDALPWRRTNKRAAAQVGLRVGTALTAALVAALESAEHRGAEDTALRLLGYRARSTHELRGKLTTSGFPPEVVSEQLRRLARAGYLDDAEFARAWIDERVHAKHYGARRIRAELLSRGVDPDFFEELLETLCSEEAERARAWKLLEARFGAPPQADSAAHQRRTYQWLLRRGFSPSVAQAAARRLSAGTEVTAHVDEPRHGLRLLDTPQTPRYHDVGKQYFTLSKFDRDRSS